MNPEVETTKQRFFTVWWAHLWRFSILSVPATYIGAIISVFLILGLTAIGTPQWAAVPIAMVPMIFLYVGATLLSMKMILGRKLGDFQVALVTNPEHDPEHPPFDWRYGFGIAGGIIALLFILTGIGLKYGVPYLETIMIDPYVASLCAEEAKGVPVMIDDETRLDKVEPGKGKEYSYSYTFVKDEKKNVNTIHLKSVMEPNILQYAYENDFLKENVFKKGITVIYKYYDKNGEFLFDVRVPPPTDSE